MWKDFIGEQFGDYILRQSLGEGGFANVYLGEHKRDKTPAAVKLLKEQLPEGFINELRRTVLLPDHPHIIKIRDFDIKPRAFIVMDYAPHGSLRKQHPKGTRVPLDKVVSYVKQTASALQHAHDQRVIHRDVKPHNLLLKTPDFVLLSDFGIATAARSTTIKDITQGPGVAGTYEYMAPEQLIGQPCPASDQYALAIMVYEWLCGELPFSGQEYVQWLYLHQQVPPPPLQERVSSLPPAVEAVIFRALAKKPEDRFARVEDFATYLEQAATGKVPPFHDTIEQLIREGMQAQTRGEVQRAHQLLQQVMAMPNVPSHYLEVAQNAIQELRPQITTLIRKRAKEAALQGQWHNEIGAWEELLTLSPLDREIGLPLTLGTRKGDVKQRIQERIGIAQQNAQRTWMYANAEQCIHEQDKASAGKLLRMLWEKAPYYGDPADLAQMVGLPPAKNYEQALAEEQALMHAQEQAHKHAVEGQTRLKRQRQGSVISIFLSIASVVLSAIAMIGVTAATHLSLMFILLATIVGTGIGIEVTVQSLRKLTTTNIVLTAITASTTTTTKVPTALSITAAIAAILAIIAAAILAAILAEALVTSGAIAIVIAGLGLLAAAIILVGTAAVVIIKSNK